MTEATIRRAGKNSSCTLAFWAVLCQSFGLTCHPLLPHPASKCQTKCQVLRLVSSCSNACYPSLLGSRLSIAPFFEVKLVSDKEIVLLDLVRAWM